MAKRFVFRYETLLRIRRQREDQHKRVVAERLRQIGAARDRLGLLRQQISDEESAIRASQGPGVLDMQQIVRHRHWLWALHRCILDAESSIRVLEGRLVQERAALAEAVKQRKILDKLKEQRLERHLQDERRHEINAADDLTTVRYVFGQNAAMELKTEN